MTLAGGEETTLEFVYAFDAEGEFDVGVETVTTVSVTSVEPPKDDGKDDTSDDDDDSDVEDDHSAQGEADTDDDPSGLGFGPIIGLVGALGGIGYVLRHRLAE
ncbi:hypothetical protein [Natronosalvus vescus]|uniref:hypothetical protein n=1 Tax=Natronosalvus vescus TaxID=2953881 RepID=UPI0020912CA6|nr:hypothetical protein [Natronosalvus vescus]